MKLVTRCFLLCKSVIFPCSSVSHAIGEISQVASGPQNKITVIIIMLSFVATVENSPGSLIFVVPDSML